ncbi:MAG: SDR family NAD(P)-dependent oxidoreductase, partial [Rhodomicrobium sp.]
DPRVRAMVAQVEKRFGRLDALVNNAGTTSNVGPKDFDAMTPEDVYAHFCSLWIAAGRCPSH